MVRRVAIHLLDAKLNHMDITIQYLNKGNISGGVPNLKHTAATKARYLVDGCKESSTTNSQVGKETFLTIAAVEIVFLKHVFLDKELMFQDNFQVKQE